MALVANDMINGIGANSMRKIFICVHCGKQMRDECDIKRHLRTHTNERPHPCSFCPMSFRLKNDRDIHARIHTGEKPYMCAICGHRFRSSSSLSSHKKQHLSGALKRNEKANNETNQTNTEINSEQDCVFSSL